MLYDKAVNQLSSLFLSIRFNILYPPVSLIKTPSRYSGYNVFPISLVTSSAERSSICINSALFFIIGSFGYNPPDTPGKPGCVPGMLNSQPFSSSSSDAITSFIPSMLKPAKLPITIKSAKAIIITIITVIKKTAICTLIPQVSALSLKSMLFTFLNASFLCDSAIGPLARLTASLACFMLSVFVIFLILERRNVLCMNIISASNILPCGTSKGY